jgi:hypothetical protein
MEDNTAPAPPPDTAAAWADLCQALIDLADAADTTALGNAKADLEKAKTAWVNGWSKGVAGLAPESTPTPALG